MIQDFRVWFLNMEVAERRAHENLSRDSPMELRLTIRGEAERFCGVAFIMAVFLTAWVQWE